MPSLTASVITLLRSSLHRNLPNRPYRVAFPRRVVDQQIVTQLSVELSEHLQFPETRFRSAWSGAEPPCAPARGCGCLSKGPSYAPNS